MKYLIPDPVIDYIKKHNLYQVINYSSHAIVYCGDIFHNNANCLQKLILRFPTNINKE